MVLWLARMESLCRLILPPNHGPPLLPLPLQRTLPHCLHHCFLFCRACVLLVFACAMFARPPRHPFPPPLLPLPLHQPLPARARARTRRRPPLHPLLLPPPPLPSPHRLHLHQPPAKRARGRGRALLHPQPPPPPPPLLPRPPPQSPPRCVPPCPCPLPLRACVACLCCCCHLTLASCVVLRTGGGVAVQGIWWAGGWENAAHVLVDPPPPRCICVHALIRNASPTPPRVCRLQPAAPVEDGWEVVKRKVKAPKPADGATSD